MQIAALYVNKCTVLRTGRYPIGRFYLLRHNVKPSSCNHIW